MSYNANVRTMIAQANAAWFRAMPSFTTSHILIKPDAGSVNPFFLPPYMTPLRYAIHLTLAEQDDAMARRRLEVVEALTDGWVEVLRPNEVETAEYVAWLDRGRPDMARMDVAVSSPSEAMVKGVAAAVARALGTSGQMKAALLRFVRSHGNMVREMEGVLHLMVRGGVLDAETGAITSRMVFEDFGEVFAELVKRRDLIGEELVRLMMRYGRKALFDFRRAVKPWPMFLSYAQDDYRMGRGNTVVHFAVKEGIRRGALQLVASLLEEEEGVFQTLVKNEHGLTPRGVLDTFDLNRLAIQETNPRDLISMYGPYRPVLHGALWDTLADRKAALTRMLLAAERRVRQARRHVFMLGLQRPSLNSRLSKELATRIADLATR